MAWPVAIVHSANHCPLRYPGSPLYVNVWDVGSDVTGAVPFTQQQEEHGEQEGNERGGNKETPTNNLCVFLRRGGGKAVG